MLQLLEFENDIKIVKDLETGEVLGEIGKDFRLHISRIFEKRSPNFVITEQFELEHIAKLRLTSVEYSVYFFIVAKCEFENWFNFSANYICEELHLTKAQVSNALKRLIECKMIFKKRNKIDIRRLRVNPAHAWRGSLKMQRKAMLEFSDASLLKKYLEEQQAIYDASLNAKVGEF